MSSGVACFNVAASIKMRKSETEKAKALQWQSLQCGRIYKDAEIVRRDKARIGANVRASMWPHL